MMICFDLTDGGSSNRKFFWATWQEIKINPHLQDQKSLLSSLYFVADPPHLIKTARNCWSHSGVNGTRLMQLNGKFITWKQLWDLYDAISEVQASSCGLTFLPKLEREHLDLTSYSRMRVDLAAQVLSKSVSDALAYFKNPDTKETQKFVLMMDRFFDCLNVRSMSEWALKRKPDLKPYFSPDDERFDWLKNVFLKYLDDWKK